MPGVFALGSFNIEKTHCTRDEWIFAEWVRSYTMAPGEKAFLAGDETGVEPFIIDRGIILNGRKIPGFGSTIGDPLKHVGRPAETCYTSVPAVEVTGDLRVDGPWYGYMISWGPTFTSGPLYLVFK